MAAQRVPFRELQEERQEVRWRLTVELGLVVTLTVILVLIYLFNTQSTSEHQTWSSHCCLVLISTLLGFVSVIAMT